VLIDATGTVLVVDVAALILPRMHAEDVVGGVIEVIGEGVGGLVKPNSSPVSSSNHLSNKKLPEKI
jgi:hypothetical protein